MKATFITGPETSYQQQARERRERRALLRMGLFLMLAGALGALFMYLFGR